MELIYATILVGAGLLVVSIFTSVISFRIGAPLLLVFLGVGLLARQIGITVENPSAAFLVGSAALAVILFDSGFQTPLQSYRTAAAPALALAGLGTILTTGILGLAAGVLFGLDWPLAFLLAATVSSTDAAAVFFLLRVGGIHIRDRVRSTLEIESGTNDPVAIFLVVTLVEAVTADASWGLTRLAAFFVLQIGGGVALGAAGGFLIVAVVNRVRLDPGLYPVITLALALFVFAATNVAGGSGFLAAYVAGLVAGNQPMQGAHALRRFQSGLTWLSQIIMFVTLGMLATPAQFPQLAPAAAMLAAVLIVLARPLAVWACLLPFRFTRQEAAFIAWVGLRGAVSILLALVPLIAGLPEGPVIFDVVFLVVVLSLLVQGWTVRPLARRLGLIVPERAGPVERLELDLPGLREMELVTYRIRPDSPVAKGQRLPRWARPSLIERGGQVMNVHRARGLRPGDHLYIFAPPSRLPLLDRLFAGTRPIAEDDRAFFGDFSLRPEVTLGALAEMYGLPLRPENAERSVGALLRDAFGERIEVGDRMVLGDVEIVVRRIEDGRVSEVGLVVEPAPPPRIPLFQSPEEIRRAAASAWRRLQQRRKNRKNPG